MIEPTRIKGICAGCGSSIPEKSEGDLCVSNMLFDVFGHGLPKPGPVRICKLCAEGICNVVLGMRAMTHYTPEMLADYRRSRLAQLLPKNLFEFAAKRKNYRMKELLMLQPMGPRVLVKRIDAPKPASSTLIIPETVDGEKSCYAIVLAIGKLTEDIKVADTVILTAYCGSPVQVVLEGETLEAIVVMESDILAVVED